VAKSCQSLRQTGLISYIIQLNFTAEKRMQTSSNYLYPFQYS